MSKIDLVIDSRYENVGLVGTCIGLFASELFSDVDCYQIQTCVVEAVTNCIEHSYAEVEGHQVTISYQADEAKIIIAIADTGIAMNPQIFMDISTHFDYDPLDVDSLPEGGLGVKVIKAWMDDVRYYSEDGINHLILVKYAHSKKDAAAFGLMSGNGSC